MNKLYTLIALAVIVYFLLQFYEEYAKNKLVSDANQMAYDEYANAQYINQTKGRDIKNWEYMLNSMFDPGNLFGFR